MENGSIDLTTIQMGGWYMRLKKALKIQYYGGRYGSLRKLVRDHMTACYKYRHYMQKRKSIKNTLINLIKTKWDRQSCVLHT